MITVDSLTKKYGDMIAVDDVSFTASPGRVTGFLGPNGAGKSTTMRMMVGLTSATSGTTHLLGRTFADLPNPGREVGVLLDASAQHAGRTGREILGIAAHSMGLPRGRVEAMLDRVSLTEVEAGRRVRNYSLGMRQRLGIAAALLGDPEVLILDEPANGLDPAGIRWMRDLLRDFADQGGTVLLSSHLLHEIEVVADDIVVIGNGRIVAQGTKDELLAAGGSLVRADDVAALASALTAAGLVVHPDHEGSLRVESDLATIGRAALAARIALTELRAADGARLEEMFLDLTAATQRDQLGDQLTGSLEGSAA
jgi:ABC-2 type transport system ATP-binding protein